MAWRRTYHLVLTITTPRTARMIGRLLQCLLFALGIAATCAPAAADDVTNPNSIFGCWGWLGQAEDGTNLSTIFCVKKWGVVEVHTVEKGWNRGWKKGDDPRGETFVETANDYIKFAVDPIHGLTLNGYRCNMAMSADGNTLDLSKNTSQRDLWPCGGIFTRCSDFQDCFTAFPLVVPPKR
jgi:hypothetical protein